MTEPRLLTNDRPQSTDEEAVLLLDELPSPAPGRKWLSAPRRIGLVLMGILVCAASGLAFTTNGQQLLHSSKDFIMRHCSFTIVDSRIECFGTDCTLFVPEENTYFYRYLGNGICRWNYCTCWPPFKTVALNAEQAAEACMKDVLCVGFTFDGVATSQLFYVIQTGVLTKTGLQQPGPNGVLAASCGAATTVNWVNNKCDGTWQCYKKSTFNSTTAAPKAM